MNSERLGTRLYYTSISKTMRLELEITQQRLQVTVLTWMVFAANVCSGCPYHFELLQNFTVLCNHSSPVDSLDTRFCCDQIYGAAVNSIAKYTNSTGFMYIGDSEARNCLRDLEENLTSTWNLQPEFFRNECPLPAFRITRDTTPCNFRRITDLRRLVDLADASHACSEQLQGPQKIGCQDCQAQILKATMNLSTITGGQPGSCGTSIAVALISLNPDFITFNNFYTCVLQIFGSAPISEILNMTGASGPAPISGNPNSVKASSNLSSKTLIILIGTLGGFAAAGFLTLAGICIARSSNSGYVLPSIFSVTRSLMSSDSSEAAVVLPKEGFYIFTLRELAKATKNFSNSLVIGEGSAGTVFAGQLPSGKLIAVKRILKEKKLETFYKEIELLARIRHPNLTALLGYCQSKSVHLLVYEYMSNGDLAQNLLGKSPPALPWDIRIRIARDCAMGLTYLHEYSDGPIIHRDIKPTNILLNEVMEAKLSDFGLSKILSTEASHISTEVKGTTGYLDPEYLILGQLTESSDVYSFGIVLLQLISGRKAIDIDSQLNRSIVQFASSVMDGELEFKDIIDPRLEGHYSYAAFRKLMEVAYGCVQPRSYDRPSMPDVLDSLELAMRLGRAQPPIDS